MRTGIGYDIHRLIPTVEPSNILLGGVSIPCLFKVNSKSDGDVLLHALTDALLGSLALGDVGQYFSDGKSENVVLSGTEMVKQVVSHLHVMGWRVAQFDCIVLAEEPRLAPHTDDIRRQIATLLNTELSAVSVKGKSMEGLGPVGERKAISAHAAVNLEKLS